MITLIPVKTDPLPKSRLAAVLGVDVRRAVMRDLLVRTIETAQAAGAPAPLIVTGNDDARAIAARYGLPTAPDTGAGPNDAVMAAAASAAAEGAALIAVLAADLPLLEPHDVACLLRRAGPGRLTIAPDRGGSGTNAVVSPPGLHYRFGAASFLAHTACARQRDWDIAVVRTVGLAADLDTPWDLDLLAHHGIVLPDLETDTTIAPSGSHRRATSVGPWRDYA